MKKEYSSPFMEIEVFEASEYIASCIKTNVSGINGGFLWQCIGPGKVDGQCAFDVIPEIDNKIDLCNENHDEHSISSSKLERGLWESTVDKIDVNYWKGNCSKPYHAINMVGSKEQSLATATTNAS